MKKILGLLVAVLMLFSTAAVVLSDEEDDQENNEDFSISAKGKGSFKLPGLMAKSDQNLGVRINTEDRDEDNAKQEERQQLIAEMLGNISAEEQVTLGRLSPAQIKYVLRAEDKAEARARLHIMANGVANAGIGRFVSAEAREKAELRFQAASKNFLGLRHEVKEAFEEFKEARKELKKCTHDCDEEEVFTAAQAYVVASGNLILEHITRIEAKIESNSELSANLSNALLAALAQAKIEVKAGIEAATAAKTREELRAAATSISAAWLRVRQIAGGSALRVLNTKVHGIVKRSENLPNQLEKLLERIEARGVVVADLEAKIESFNAHTQAAIELNAQSNARLEAALQAMIAGNLTAKQRQEITASVREANELSRKAHTELRLAHKLLVELVQEINIRDSDNGLELILSNNQDAEGEVSA